MSRSKLLAALIVAALSGSLAQATPGDSSGGRNHDWRGKQLCANCEPDHYQPASRIRNEVRIATKLVAPNTCADPGPVAWFAEEEDHVSAFLNSSEVRYK